MWGACGLHERSMSGNRQHWERTAATGKRCDVNLECVGVLNGTTIHVPRGYQLHGVEVAARSRAHRCVLIGQFASCMTYAGSPAIYRKTKDIRLTQRLPATSRILTTAIYSHPTDEDLLRAVTGLPC